MLTLLSTHVFEHVNTWKCFNTLNFSGAATVADTTRAEYLDIAQSTEIRHLDCPGTTDLVLERFKTTEITQLCSPCRTRGSLAMQTNE